MKIALDAFGGDHAPLEILKGAAMAVAELDVQVLLTGNREKIESCARENGISTAGMEFLHTPDVITMHDDAGEIVKSLKNCSMALALKETAAGRADAAVSAGSTGALVMGGTFLVKRLAGVKRAALGNLMPSKDGHFFLMDMGANVECRPEMLCQFAVMASAYVGRVLKRANPSVGLLNVGTEATKGDALRHEAYALLEQAPVRFVGNIEARDLMDGVCDIVITDGFTGNIVLKLTEGVASSMFGLLKRAFLANAKTKIGAMLVKPGLREIKKKTDYTEIGGAPLLGLRKPVIKAHGSSNAAAIKNAVRLARDFASAGAIEHMALSLAKGQGDS